MNKSANIVASFDPTILPQNLSKKFVLPKLNKNNICLKVIHITDNMLIPFSNRLNV